MHSSIPHPESGEAKKHSDATGICVTFVVLCFLLSSPFWYLRAHGSHGFRMSVATMWCPGLAALLTSLVYRRSLKAFGFKLGQLRWLMLALLLPAFAGLVIYGSAWLSQIAPLDASKFPKLFSLSFIPLFLVGLLGMTFAALGEELGWRGLLVPELSRRMSYTKLSFVSGLIWAIWHLPVILPSFSGSGPLWISLLAFTVWIVASGFVQAWMRLVSGSVWVSALLHGSSNYFIQLFYPTLTKQTPQGDAMLGEFGWAIPVVSTVIAIVFWCYRSRGQA